MGSYTRIASPALTIRDGGLQKIDEVLGLLKGAKVDAGETGACRLYLDRNVFTPDELQRLYRLQRANEDILFTLAKEGGKGRTLSHKKEYSLPLNSGSTSNYRCGVNESQAGWLEFRYFDSTTNAEPVKANVTMLLGMAKAAVENTASPGRAHRTNTLNLPISARRFHGFLDQTVGQGPARTQLEQQFFASGGRLAAGDPLLRGSIAMGTAASLLLASKGLAQSLIGWSGAAHYATAAAVGGTALLGLYLARCAVRGTVALVERLRHSSSAGAIASSGWKPHVLNEMTRVRSGLAVGTALALAAPGVLPHLGYAAAASAAHPLAAGLALATTAALGATAVARTVAHVARGR